MVKLDVIGSTAMYGIYIGVGVYVLRSILSIIFGYIYFPVDYAGPSYYFWRHKFCDQTIARSSFDPIAKNADNQQEPFLTYIQTVQPFDKNKSIKQDLEKTSKSLAKAQKDLAEAQKLTSSKKQETVDAAQEKVNKLKKEVEDLSTKDPLSLEFNSLGFTALLNTPGFSEGFAYDAKKNYKIFKQFQKDNENKVMEADFHFLAFRHLFIKYLKHIKPSSKNWSTIATDQLDNFIRPSRTSDITFTPHQILQVNQSSLKEFSVTIDGKDYSIYIPSSYIDSINGYFSAAKSFQELVAKMMAAETPMFKAVDNKLVFDGKDYFSDIMSICKSIGLSSFFETNGNFDEQLFKEKVEAFFTRIGSIKATPLDIHILNRIYSFYLITHSDINYVVHTNDHIKENAEIQAKIDKVADVMKANKDNKNSSIYQTASRKHSVLVKSFEKRLIEQRFNAFSEIIARNLGSKGYVLDSKEDSRIPVLKYFVYPSVYKTSKKAKVTSPFSSSAVNAS